ncbi:hypothetical protein I302_105366 [Kwoniella bestiolae CBS 10118]|uniref:Uncharacterized protein n=1 Tax=Kwoniella bestiolae CBS 10118 TaxID=1296100 RepID=A0AAJ8K9Q8_9TREE
MVYRALCLTVANREEAQSSINIQDTTIESLKEMNDRPVLRLTSPTLTESNVTLEVMKMEDAGMCSACGAKGEFWRCPSL